MAALLEIENLEAFYGKARALRGISLCVEEGAMVGVIGPNGAGKSTLLDSVMGLTDARGAIRFEGRDLLGRKPAEIVRLGVGYAPERGHLFPYMSVEENLLVGGLTARRAMQENLKRVYELFPNLKERHRQETSTQSGGERQMVSVGRALMTNPKLLLIDEPTLGLAPKICLDIAASLRRLNEETGLTVLIAEQNVNFAMNLAQDAYILDTGEIRTSGAVADLRSDPVLRAAYFGE